MPLHGVLFNIALLLISSIIGVIFGISLLGSAVFRSNRRVKKITMIVCFILGITGASGTYFKYFKNGFNLSYEPSQWTSLHVDQTTLLPVLFGLSLSTICSFILAMRSEYKKYQRLVPEALRHLAPTYVDIFKLPREECEQRANALAINCSMLPQDKKNNLKTPIISRSNLDIKERLLKKHISTTYKNVKDIPIPKSYSNIHRSRGHIITFAKTYHERYEELLHDNKFQAEVNIILESITAGVLEKENDIWSELNRQLHFIQSANRVVKLFPSGTARFSMRVFKDYVMHVWATSHTDNISGGIDVRSNNSISYSAHIGKPVMFSEHPQMHQETAGKKKREWTNYVSQCILLHNSETEYPLFSLCLDVAGDEADYILRYLHATGFFERLTRAINSCFVYFAKQLEISPHEVVEKHMKPINMNETEN